MLTPTSCCRNTRELSRRVRSQASESGGAAGGAAAMDGGPACPQAVCKRQQQPQQGADKAGKKGQSSGHGPQLTAQRRFGYELNCLLRAASHYGTNHGNAFYAVLQMVEVAALFIIG